MSKIIILTYNFPPQNGGISRLCAEIKKELDNQNIPNIVITRDFGKDSKEKDIVRISGNRGLLEYRILRFLIENTSKDDIVITGTFHPEALISILSGRKTYILAHGAELLSGNNFFRRTIWSFYRKQILCLAKRVIANSHYTEDLIKNCSPKIKTSVLPLAVDSKSFYPSKPKIDDGLLHICSVSRLLKFKGQDFIIKTIASLPEYYKNKVKLHIGGKGEYRKTLEELVSNYNIKNNVTFDGYLSDEELRDYYSTADVFVLCTREDSFNQNVEGFGLVFVEAQACGTPVIGTKTGGISDAICEGNGGWLINQDSERELSDLIKKLIDNPNLKIEEGKKARIRVQSDMNWNQYIIKLNKILNI